MLRGSHVINKWSHEQCFTYGMGVMFYFYHMCICMTLLTGLASRTLKLFSIFHYLRNDIPRFDKIPHNNKGKNPSYSQFRIKKFLTSQSNSLLTKIISVKRYYNNFFKTIIICWFQLFKNFIRNYFYLFYICTFLNT